MSATTRAQKTIAEADTVTKAWKVMEALLMETGLSDATILANARAYAKLANAAK